MQAAMFSFIRKNTEMSYHRLSDDEKLSEDSAFIPGGTSLRESKQRIWPYVIPWMVSTSVFAFLSLYFYLSSLEPAYGSFERGWSTDFCESQLEIVGVGHSSNGEFFSCCSRLYREARHRLYGWSYLRSKWHILCAQPGQDRLRGKVKPRSRSSMGGINLGFVRRSAQINFD